MAKVVIIGASTGGLPAAYEIKAAIGSTHDVTVISDTEIFHFVPSNPWVAVGWRDRKDISLPLKPCLEKRGINFIPDAAQKIDPVANKIITKSGTVVSYDYLVIATGPKLAFEEVDGLGPEANTVSICTLDLWSLGLHKGHHASARHMNLHLYSTQTLERGEFVIRSL